MVALFEDEATVKTYQLKNGHLWLLPENPDYEPIDGTHAEIPFPPSTICVDLRYVKKL